MIKYLSKFVKSLFHRNHKWERVLDEDGMITFERKCSICGKEQEFVYYRHGNQRFAWMDKEKFF